MYKKIIVLFLVLLFSASSAFAGECQDKEDFLATLLIFAQGHYVSTENIGEKVTSKNYSFTIKIMERDLSEVFVHVKTSAKCKDVKVVFEPKVPSLARTSAEELVNSAVAYSRIPVDKVEVLK